MFGRCGLLIALCLIAPPAVAENDAGACSCPPLKSPKEGLEEAAAVFSGKVLEIADSRYGYEVTFEVEKVWKGEIGPKVGITTGTGFGDCGYEFVVKKKYLVYAYGEDRLVTGICSRTAKLNKSKADLTALGEGKPPKGE